MEIRQGRTLTRVGDGDKRVGGEERRKGDKTEIEKVKMREMFLVESERLTRVAVENHVDGRRSHGTGERRGAQKPRRFTNWKKKSSKLRTMADQDLP